jgi:hypothetical protein
MKGDSVKSKEQFLGAIDIFKKCGADGWVQRIEQNLKST